MTNIATAVALMRDALQEVTINPRIAEWLRANEPDAFAQAREALYAFTGPLFIEEEEESVDG